METMIPSILIVLGLLAVFTGSRPLVQKIVFGLIGLSLISVSHVGFAEKDPQTAVLGMLGAIVGIGMAAGLLLKKHGEWVAIAGSFLAFLLGPYAVSYFGFDLKFTGFVVLLPIFGAFGPVLGNFKAKLLHNWFRIDEAKTTVAVNAFVAALLVFFSMFQAQYFGVILVASGWLAVSLATRSFHTAGTAIALLSLGFAFLLMKTHPATDDSFMRSNFLMGLITGAAAIRWVILSKDAARFKWPLMYVLSVLIVLAFVLLGKINTNFGGIPAYIGALLGASATLAVTRHEQQTIPFQALLIGISGLVLTQFAPLKIAEKHSHLTQTGEPAKAAAKPEKPDLLRVSAISMDGTMAGSWKSDPAASKVDFQLGPEGGITEGAVQAFDVRLNVNASGEPELLSVSMPTAKVTTYDPTRDQSVLGAGYLNAAGFPKMTYQSTGFRKKGDRYVVSGNFEMLGKKQSLDLEIKFAAKGEDNGRPYLVMVGRSALDRTKYGMQSDAKIGDVVDVSFEIEFRK